MSTPPPSDPHTQPALSTQLDTLLESYLSLLDTYTTLRASLSSTLSSGFLSLAQAQRSATLGAGRRYGEEYYDQRMKALRSVYIETRQVEEDSEDEDNHENEAGDNAESAEIHFAIQENESPVKTQTYTVVTDLDSGPESENQHPSSSPSQETKVPTPRPPRNPLTWFGILTPLPLRQSQATFTSALHTVSALINTSNEMAALESKILKIRPQLFNEIDTKKPSVSTSGGEDVTREKSQPKTPISQGKSPTKPKSKTTLPPRPTEPRSRILKID